MELARTTGGSGGLRFSVVGVGVNLGGKREKTDKTTHKVILRLDPHNADGSGQVEVSHQR